jgi:hypothetical protein
VIGIAAVHQWYPVHHKTSGFKTSGFKTSGFTTSGWQNVRFKKSGFKTTNKKFIYFDEASDLFCISPPIFLTLKKKYVGALHYFEKN